MISIKTTAMIASMALMGAITPAAFADYDVNQAQYAENNAYQEASGNSYSYIDQDIDQGICQVQQGQGGAYNFNTAFQYFDSDDCS
jgi:hypothetical protein